MGHKKPNYEVNEIVIFHSRLHYMSDANHPVFALIITKMKNYYDVLVENEILNVHCSQLQRIKKKPSLEEIEAMRQKSFKAN